MLHKCANPACLNPFRKLSQGKLFLVETPPPEEAMATPRKRSLSNHRIEYYWLCDQCAFALTLSYEKGRGVVAVPRPGPPVAQRMPVAAAVRQILRTGNGRAEEQPA